MPTNETMLEQTFADLAYSHLRDKSQALLDYLVGFQMLKTEDDGARAVGIFGFEIDENFYYAPVFFLNGEVRGLDSIYSVKSDLFVPLTEDWINSLINRRQVELGEPDKRSREQRGVRMPNYTRLKIIPGGTGGISLKVASSGMLVKESVPTLVALMSDPRTDQVDDLPHCLNAFPGMTSMFKQAMESHPQLQSAVQRWYDWMDFVEPKTEKQAAATSPVVVINNVSQAPPSELTDAQRKELTTGGVAVIDKRPESDKSILYSTQTKLQMTNPTCGGMYDVLCADGSVNEAIVVPVEGKQSRVFVFCIEDKRYATVDPGYVWVLRKYEHKHYLDWIEKNGADAAAVPNEAAAIWLSKDGVASLPFCVEDKMDGADGITVYKVRDPYYCDAKESCCGSAIAGYGRFSGGPQPAVGTDDIPTRLGGQIPMWRSVSEPERRVRQVIVRNKDGDNTGYSTGKVVYTTDKLVINAPAFKSIVLNRFSVEKGEHSDLYPHESYEKDRYKQLLSLSDFGNKDTVVQQVEKIASSGGDVSKITTWKDGKDLIVKDQFGRHTFDKVAAYKHFIYKHALAQEDAQLLWEDAKPRWETDYLVKKAENAMLPFPDIFDTDNGGELSAFHRTEVPFKNINQNVRDNNREFYTYDSPFSGGGFEPSEEANDQVDTLGTVDKASQLGQKDVFDAAALGSLIKSKSPTDLVDRFLPTITAGMDRLGRILFLIYWHYEAFEERYGEKDISEYIDNLKSVFESIGDIVIFSKKRTLAGDPEHYGVGSLPVESGDAG